MLIKLNGYLSAFIEIRKTKNMALVLEICIGLSEIIFWFSLALPSVTLINVSTRKGIENR